jgi:phage N-6-adenine-methyltransferase
MTTACNNALKAAHFSQARPDWETPQDLFDKLNAEFGFTLDVCATAENAKCKRFFTPEDDGLKQSWAGEVCFCNPPYGKNIKDWADNAHYHANMSGATVVMLIPARTDSGWWHDHIIGSGAEVRFLKGRIKFKGAKYNAPFPSAVVVFRPKTSGVQR